MEPQLIWIAVIIASVILGIHGAYYGALGRACLKIGTALEGATAGTTGFQDAITPPESTNAHLTNWVATLLVAGGSWYYLDFVTLVVFLAIRVFTTAACGAFLNADPPKSHFCRRIYSSMANREADFVKAGDQMRADAMRTLRLRFEQTLFANHLTR